MDEAILRWKQVEKMAKRVARLYGGSPILNAFEINDSFIYLSDLCIKDFGGETSEEWARFVMNNRNRKYDDFSNPECNFDNKYDVVIGPIADNDMAGLYRESPAYVYGLFQDEMNFGKILQTEL